MNSRFQNYARSIGEVGLLPAILNKIQRMRLQHIRPKNSFLMRSKHTKFALMCRPDSSDIRVFDQIFHMREYRCLDDVGSAELIIDCGANVGYSAAYFLSRYPESRLVAVEPDPQNFKVLQANVKDFGARATCICSGIWSSPTGLVFAAETLVQGKEWGRTVRQAAFGEAPDVMAIDIGSILERDGAKRISILKIDIEGSEAAVFSEHFEKWIDKVDNLVIELHGPDCAEVFNKAIAGRGFHVTHCDELTVCKRPNANRLGLAMTAQAAQPQTAVSGDRA